MKRLLVRLTLGLLLAASLAGVWVVWRAHTAYAAAEELAQRAEWGRSRSLLERYLWLHPRDARAHLLMAEAFVMDRSIPTLEAVGHAITRLHRIPDRSPLGGEARMKEARLRFLLLLQPYRAEPLFRKALRLGPETAECYYLLWKLYDLTGRSDQAAPLCWATYERSRPELRGQRLREWYMSQFFPLLANPDLDRAIGFLKKGEQPTSRTEYDRLLEFAARDPRSPKAVAGVARWFHRTGDPAFALKLLDARQDLESPFEDTDYVSTLVAVLFDLGEFDRVVREFDRWPEPREGYEFWKWHGMLLDEIHRDYRRAFDAYEQALAQWPGPVDWRTQFRAAQCLAKMGEHKRAHDLRERSKVVEELMEEETHSRLRRLLADLRNAQGLQHVASFYRQLGLSREADAWSEYIEGLESLAAQPRFPRHMLDYRRDAVSRRMNL